MPRPAAKPKRRSSPPIAPALLHWYDAHARDLPWRIGPAARAEGVAPDPYRVWLSEIMLQQTTVATVRGRFEVFLERWPRVEALAAAAQDDVLAEWAGLGYYARARNLHACARVVADQHGGVFPTTEEGLLALPGVGAYTAAAIAAIAFDAPAVVVDGNVERVTARLFALDRPLKVAKGDIRALAADYWPAARSGDFAQALMDLGAAVCTPKSPSCLLCPIADHCAARASGDPVRYPPKPTKAAKPERRGVAFALFDAEGRILLERRPARGLLGGMLGLPGGPWAAHEPGAVVEAEPPIAARWRSVGAIRHTFTHFHLTLEVRVGRAAKRFRPGAAQEWADPTTARLPTVMRKAVDAAVAGVVDRNGAAGF